MNIENLLKILLSLPLLLSSMNVFAHEAKVTPLLTVPLNDMQNKEGMMLLVTYQPREKSIKHRHDAHAFVYVLEGSILMQVSGKDPVTLTAGETFYESPTDIHLISANASDTKTAKFLVFTLKQKDKPVLMPVK